MPKGVKGSINYDAEIAKVDIRISATKGKLQELEGKRKELNEKKEEQEMREVLKFISESGLSPEEALQKLRR